jgi:uncharacterized protein (DUF924 family)
LIGDLGLSDAEVHAKAREVLGYWFDAVAPDQWFGGSPEVDAELRDRFEGLRAQLLAAGTEGWRNTPETLLAAILVLDQFGRNMFRGTAEAYAGDLLAQQLAALALERDWDQRFAPERRQFMYLPFQHAESRELQAVSIQCYERLGLEKSLDFARQHAEVIARFGRFPTRNAALGRPSTPEEEAYLSQPGVGW